MKYSNLILPFLIFFLLISLNVNSQDFQIDKSNSEMSVAGTSTLHDWHSDVLDIDGTAKIEINNSVIKDIREMEIKVSTSSLKSGKNGMDKNAHEALKEPEYPEIQFTHTRIESSNDGEILSIGLLTIAGVTREVKMNVNYSASDSDEIVFEGSLDLKMTDFEIDPPSALLGTVKTGDSVNIEFKVRFIKI